jgi:hypothetical protein
MMLRHLSLTAAGLALFAMGCSDAPPRPAKLGLHVAIRNPDANVPQVAGRSCQTSTGVEWDIGKATKSGTQIIVDSPTPTDFGTTLEHGKGGTRIQCTVRKSGAFSAVGEGVDPQITAPNGLITFTLGGTAKSSGTPATNTATATVYTPQTQEIGTSPGFPGCIITSVHEQAPGALWADFDCPALTKTGDPAHACHALGTIVLEYCKTGEEDD